MSAESGHRLVDHPADVGIEAWGPTFEVVLDEAIRALAEIHAGGPPPDGEPHEVSLDLQPLIDEEVLYAVLQEALYLLEARQLLVTRLEPHDRPEPGRRYRLVGVRVPSGFLEGTPIKAVTWHDLEVRRDPDGVHARVLLDL